MTCPICGIGLKITHQEGVEIDYCPRCRGVWLDRGELDKIITASRRHEDERDWDDDDNGFRPARVARPDSSPPRKGEGFFERFFDFD